MLEELCLIIPTHNRPSYVARTIQYLININYLGDVVICDSSDTPWRGDLPKHIEILHFPGVTFANKVLNVISKKTHNLFLLCADDDFIILPSVLKGYEFMQKKPSYSCYSGAFYFYLKEEISRDFFNFSKSVSRNISGSTPEKRAIRLMSNYHMMLWNMFRRDTLLIAFKGIIESKLSNDNYIEMIISITAVMNGAIEINKDPWIIRERSITEDSWGRRHKALSLERIKREQDVKNDYIKSANYFERIYGVLGQKTWEVGMNCYFEMLNPTRFIRVARRIIFKAKRKFLSLLKTPSQVPLISRNKQELKNLSIIKNTILTTIKIKE